MKYILTHKELKASAKMLAEFLDIKLSLTPLAEAPAIRWGNCAGNYPLDTKFNESRLIALTRKDLFSTGMNKANIPHVHVYHSDTKPEHFPIVLRTRLNAKGGEGIVVIRSKEEYERAKVVSHWSYWYKFDFELGVHTFKGEIIRVFKKVWAGEGPEPEFPIRNQDRGFHFKLVNVLNYKKLPAYIHRIYEAFPINFCRFDIGWDAGEHTYRVLECNSAPQLSANPETFRLYAEKLREVV